MLMIPACVSSRNKFCLCIRGAGNRSGRPCSWSSAASLSEVIKDVSRRPSEASESLFNQSGRPRKAGIWVLISWMQPCLSEARSSPG